MKFREHSRLVIVHRIHTRLFYRFIAERDCSVKISYEARTEDLFSLSIVLFPIGIAVTNCLKFKNPSRVVERRPCFYSWANNFWT